MTEDKNPYQGWLERVVIAALKAGVIIEGGLWTKTIEDIEKHFEALSK